MPAVRPKNITVDFTGVAVGGGLRSDHVPEGDYLTKITDCQQFDVKDQEGVKRLVWVHEIVEPTKYAGKKVTNSTTLKKESLWALRGMLIDLLGEDKVPESSLSIPIEKIVKAQKQVGITTEDDEYKGKLKSRVAGTFSKAEWAARNIADPDDDDEDEDADEDEVKTKATSADDDEDMDEIDVDDI